MTVPSSLQHLTCSHTHSYHYKKTTTSSLLCNGLGEGWGQAIRSAVYINSMPQRHHEITGKSRKKNRRERVNYALT